MIILSEHDAMQRIVNGLKLAEDGARMMMAHRPDQARGWELMAQTYRVCGESAWKLAEEAVKRSTKQ
jgi:hypothetical protein